MKNSTNFTNGQLTFTFRFLSAPLLISLFLLATPAQAATITVTNGNDTGAGSLRNAISSAAAGDIIVFSGVTTVTLTSAELLINKNLTINGGTNGVTITRSGSTQFRIFNISSGTVSLSKLTIHNGRHPEQAGGLQNNGILTMTDCAITGNTAPQSGGIQNDNVMTMTNCTISGNSATSSTAQGGGYASFGTMNTMTNCTISGNTTSAGGVGGGLHIAGSGPLNMTNCTVTNNTAGSSGAINMNAPTSLFKNTIVAGNNATVGAHDNIAGNISSSSSNNLIGADGSGGLTNGVNGNIVTSAAPLLGTLASNGGYTQTHALNACSPAINAGTSSGAPSTDQRGSSRVGAVDIGSFEYQSTPSSISITSSVTNACNGNNGSIDLTVTGGSSPYTYTWSGSGSGTDPRTNLAAGTYNVTVTGGGCTGTHTAMVTNITPTTANAGPNQTGSATCGLTQVTLAANNPTVGTGMWSVVSGTGGSFGNPSSRTSTFTGTAGSTYTLRWTISNSTCTSTDDVVITFNRNPTTANAGPDQSSSATCGLTQVTLAANTPTVGTGMWSVVTGTGGSFGNASSPNSTFSGTAGSTYTLRWTISNSPCTASTDDVVVTFNRNPTTANAGPDQTGATTCGLTQVTLAANTPTVGAGAWSIVSGTGGTFGNASSPTSTFSGTAGSTYTLRWTISNSPCTASTDDVTVTLNSNPLVTCPGNFTAQDNDPVFALSGGTPAGGTYSGTGVSSGMFDPAISGLGMFTIQYDYTSPAGCSGSCTFTIEVLASCTVLTWYKDSDDDGYSDGTTLAQCLRPNGYKLSTELTAISGDCDDTNNAINPAAAEICDGIDNDCDGSTDEGVQTTYYRDMDGDTFGDPAVTQQACSAPSGYVANNTDCDDTNNALNPNTVWYLDADGDGYYTGTGVTQCASPGAGYRYTGILGGGDCDDSNAAIRPGATESCNGIDDNCNGMTDEGITFVTYYQDSDGDTFGNPAVSQSTCDGPPTGYVSNNLDCDDSNNALNPNTVWYLDADGDGYYTGTGVTQCASPGAGYRYTGILGGGDCNDGNAAIHPGATESCNGIDDNCNGMTDEGISFVTYYQDSDGDTFGNPAVSQSTCDGPPTGYVSNNLDCNDTNNALNPNTVWYLDADGDGYYTGTGVTQCASPGAGYRYTGILGGGDCDDSNAAIRPGATESCNGIDDNCNGMTDEGITFVTYYQDSDGDTFGNPAVSQSTCDGPPTGYVSNNLDCNDTNNTLNPNTVWYLDADGDGYYTGTGVTQCASPGAGYRYTGILGGGDCNDSNAAIHPGATESCNGIDDNCNGMTDEGITFVTYYQDSDGDTFGNPAVSQSTCDGPPTGYVSNNLDCNDSNNALNPNTVWYLDADGDGYYTGTGVTQCASPGAGYRYTGILGGGDCNDNNAAINPAATEICNGIDDDCDGLTDVADPDLMSTPLQMSCPAAQTLPLNSTCSATLPDYRSLANLSGGCGTVTVTQMPLPGTSVSQAGSMIVTITASDQSGNMQSCTLTVNKLDVTPPSVTCFNGSVVFNGQSSIALDADALSDASDNCGIQSISLSPTAIFATQVGQNVPVTVTVTDLSGNTASCISTVSVSGLPEGWSQTPDGVGCAGGNSNTYNPATGVWTATSTNCFYGPPFTQDASSFAQRRLCGDGSITVQVTGIVGGGWAGVVMRESNAPGAKKAQLLTNLGQYHRREFRTATNGQAAPQQISSNGRHWLRIVRAGNQFTLYASGNGTSWFIIGAQNIVMSNCIELGLVATNQTANSSVTATFANMSFSGSNGILGSPLTPHLSPLIPLDSPLTPEFDVFPNPTGGELNVDLAQYVGLNVRIEVYGIEGKLLQFREIEEVQTTVENLNLSQYAGGMYFVKVQSRDLPDATRRVVLQRE